MLLSLIFAILNAIRGSGFWNSKPPKKTPLLISVIFSRITWMFLMAMSAVMFSRYSRDGEVGLFLALMASLEFGFVCGWGHYLNVAFPNMKYITESEIKIIDWIATALYKKPTNELEFSNWCFIALFFRSMLFYPVFIVLGFYNTHALYWGCGVLLMPVVYWLRRFTPEVYAVRIAEFTYGGILGALINLSLT